VQPRAVADEIEAELKRARPLNAAALHRIAKRRAAALADASPREVLDVAIALSANERLGVRIAAFLLVLRHKPALAAIGAKDLSALARRLADCSDVDTFCLVSGRAWRAG